MDAESCPGSRKFRVPCSPAPSETLLMRTPLLLVTCAMVLLSACDSGPVISPSPRPLLPLEVGNRWILMRTVTDASGDTLAVKPDTVAVIGDTTLAGERWFALAGSSGDSQAGFGGYNTARSDGVWFRAGASSAPYLQYAYPVEPGTVYPYAPHRYTAEATVVGTGEPAAGSDGLRGYLYSIRFDSLRAPPHHPFGDGVPPLRRLLAPGVGFGEYETQYWRLDSEGTLVLLRKQSWRLVRFEPA